MVPESPAGFRTPPAAALRRPAAELPRWLALGLLAALGAAALLLGWRRLAGALESPLAWPALPLVAAVLAAAAAAVRLVGRSAPPPASVWSQRLVRWTPLVVLCAIGAALSVPGTSPAGMAVFWAILAVEELWSQRRGAERPRALVSKAAAPRPAAAAPAQLRYDLGQTSPPHPLSMMVLPEEVSPDDVVEQLIRSHAADGSEVLSGWLRVPMSAGQRSANLHVAFCPPFAQTPHLAVEQLGGPPARIKTVQLLPYGTRFDLKLDQPGGAAATVLLRFLARSGPPSGPAAEEAGGGTMNDE